MEQRRIYYGGQALIEGVMIRGPHNVAVACRRPDGEIAVRQEALGGVYTGALRRIPFLRGVIVLWETLALGMRALLFSSNVAMGEEEKEISPLSVIGMGLTALALVAVLFFAGPVLLTGWLDDMIESSLLVVTIEGLIRLAILLAYIGFIGLISLSSSPMATLEEKRRARMPRASVSQRTMTPRRNGMRLSAPL